MDTRINKYDNNEKMSRVSKNNQLYQKINDGELDSFKVRSNATVIGNQDNEIDVEQIKKILDTRYNSNVQRKSIRVEPREVESPLKEEDTKEYDLTKVLEKAKDEKEESYEENRARKLRNTQYDILNNLNIDKEEKEQEIAKEEQKNSAQENLMDLIHTITINEARVKGEIDDDDPLSLFEDLKGDNDTQAYEGMKEKIQSISEIQVKEEVKKEKEVPREVKNLDNSFYTDKLFNKKDFDEDNNDFVDDVKINIGIKILIVLLIVVFVVGLFVFLKSFLKF
mgnify:CR=1 FL=1